jgi:hypothetical protein
MVMKKELPSGTPLGDGVRQFFTDGQGHGKMVLKFVVGKSP